MKKRGGTCRARLCLLCAAVCLTAAFLTLTASAQRFPESGEFNGLYIVYNISGGRIAGASYEEGFTTTSKVTGTCGKGKLTISGTLYSRDGQICVCNASVQTSGGESDAWSGKMNSAQTSLPFSVTVPVSTDDREVTFTVRLSAMSANWQDRALEINGTLTNTGTGASGGTSGGGEEDDGIPTGWIIAGGGVGLILLCGLLKKKKKPAVPAPAKTEQPAVPVKPVPPENPVPPVKPEEPEQPEEENQEEPEKSTFRMLLYKDFGASLTLDGPERTLGARIEEVTPEGKTVPRPDMTREIAVSGGEGIRVTERGMTGRYREAGVQAVTPYGGSAPKEVWVSFTYAGEDAELTENVWFDVIGKPELVFPDQPAWASYMSVPVIAGGGENVLRIFFDNTSEEPEKLTFSDDDELAFTVKPDEYERTYRVTIRDAGAPIEKEAGAFAVPVRRGISVTAEFSGGVTVTGSFTVERCPEGLFVPKKSGASVLKVPSYARSTGAAGEPEMPSTEFELMLCAADESGRTVTADLGKTKPRFYRPEPTDDFSESTAAKYSCRIDTRSASEGRFRLTPETSLPSLGRECRVNLPVSCEYGNTYYLSLPLQLIGEPEDPMADWKKELHDLCDRVRRYFPPETALDWLAYIKENYTDPEFVSAGELRVMSHTVIRAAQIYWTDTSAQQKELFEQNAWIVNKLEWAKKLGDYAFSILITYFYGSNAEALLTPAKDFAVNSIGEWIAACYEGKDYDFSEGLFEQLLTASENLLLNQTDKMSSISPEKLKKAAFIMTGYLILDAVKNYEKMPPRERDVLDALKAAFADLTGEALKKVFGGFMNRAMNSKQMKALLEGKTGMWVQEKVNAILPGVAHGRSDTWMRTASYTGNVDIGLPEDCWVKLGYKGTVESLLNALFGDGVAKVIEENDKIGNEDYVFELDLSCVEVLGRDAKVRVCVTLPLIFEKAYDSCCRFTEWLFGGMFGGLPFAEHAVTMGRDPAAELARMGL